jgi:predicted ArsR family transcriptional regulator
MTYFCRDVALDNSLIGRTLAVLSAIEEIDRETATPEAFRKYVRRYITDTRNALNAARESQAEEAALGCWF